MLPSHLQSLFWDCDPSKLDPVVYAFYIIERVLEWGNLDQIAWLRNTYSSQELQTVVKQSRQLSPKTVAYWALILGISPEECRCSKKSSLNPLGLD